MQVLGFLYTVGVLNERIGVVHRRLDRDSDICSKFFGQRPGSPPCVGARRLHRQVRLHVSLPSLAACG